jgi:RNA polymerase sigma-70 factor (ECF subfamily)
MPDPSDQALVHETRGGDIEAYGVVVRRYQTSVFNVCYRMLGERREAEDLTQETFVRAYQRLNTYDPARPFGPWIRRIAANMCLNHLKRNRRIWLPLDDEHDLPDAGPGVDLATAVEEKVDRSRIRDAIQALPPHYRAVIELRHFQGLSYEETARALSLPLSDVRSHLYRARQLLAERLRSDE